MRIPKTIKNAGLFTATEMIRSEDIRDELSRALDLLCAGESLVVALCPLGDFSDPVVFDAGDETDDAAQQKYVAMRGQADCQMWYFPTSRLSEAFDFAS